MNTKSIVAASILGASLLVSVAAAEDDVTVYGKPHYTSRDERAVQACINAFAESIFPGRNVKVRAVMGEGSQIFNSNSLANQMDVTLSAKQRSSGKMLASANCTVSDAAKVTILRTKVQDATLVAQVSAQDISLATRAR
jgi:hypothetical protein